MIDPSKPSVRKALACINCEHVYVDEAPTSCDCMPDKEQHAEGLVAFAGDRCQVVLERGDTWQDRKDSAPGILELLKKQRVFEVVPETTVCGDSEGIFCLSDTYNRQIYVSRDQLIRLAVEILELAGLDEDQPTEVEVAKKQKSYTVEPNPKSYLHRNHESKKL